jgi:O-antigen/teichoic acid export membrane protein
VSLPNRSELRALFKNASFYMLPSWADILLVQSPLLLIGLFAREQGSILIFNVSRTLMGLARQLAIQLARSGGIEMARQIAQRDRKGLLRLHVRMGRSIGALVGVACGLILVSAEPIIAIWTGGRAEFDPLMMMAFITGVMLAGPAQCDVMLLQLSNAPRPLAMASFVQVVLVLALMALLIPRFSSLGAAVALSFSDAVAFGVIASYAAARRYALSSARFALASFSSELLGLMGGAACAMIVHMIMPARDAVGLAAFLAIWGLVMAVPTLGLMLDAPQRAKVLAYAARSARLVRRGRPADQAGRNCL